MSSHISALDLWVLGIYFLAVLGIGYGFRRKSSSVDGFTAAGRSLPGWLTGLSILGTYVSSISFLALPGKAFIDNWNPFVFSLSLPISTWIAVRWFLPFYRNSSHVSAYEHLEERFGTWARIYASFCYLLTQLARMGTVMYLMALPMSVLLGWDIRIILLITGISVTIYTFLGGLVAVIWTDALQTVILILGALVCAFLMVSGLPEGPGQLIDIAVEHGKFSLGSFGLTLFESTFWVTLVYGLVINLQNFGIDQNYIQRYFAARSDAEARKSIWIGGLLYIPVSAVFFFIGTALFAYYSVYPQELPVSYTEGGMADSVFPHFIVSVLPAGITGLLIAAVFAAAMSTVSTSLNSSATIIMNDYFIRLFRPNATEKQSMRMLHGTTIVWGALGTLIAIAMTTVRSALDAWWTLAGIFGGGILGLFLLGFLSRKPKSSCALWGVVAGVTIILWMTLSPKMEFLPQFLKSPFHNFLIIVFGTATILGVGFLLTRFLSGAKAVPQPSSNE
ncbi:MAG: sodium:solute symporter [Puniceicoccaceae bacterium]